MAIEQEPASMTAAPPPATEPMYVQQFLYCAGGIYYHLLFCCDCTDPHWSTYGASTVLGNQPCPGGGVGVNLGQTVQVSVGGLPMASPHYLFQLAPAIGHASGGGASTIRLPVGWSLGITNFGDPMTLQNNQTPRMGPINGRRFAMSFFNVRFPGPCAAAPGEQSITFGLAEPSTVGGATTPLALVNGSVISSGVTTEPQRLYGAVVNYSGIQVPVMIVANP